MNSGVNTKATEKAKVFEMLFSSPGMKEACKIVLNPSRQTVLLLGHLVEQGLGRKGEENDLLSFLPEESLTEVRVIVDELLSRSGLVEFYRHLKAL